MASFVVVGIGFLLLLFCFFFGGGGEGVGMFFFKKKNFFDGKSVMSVFCNVIMLLLL